MTRKLGEDETLKLVKLYGENECLWDIKSQHYRNKVKRAAALRNIVEQMKIEGLTPLEAKNKIKAIRATYYLEVDKIQKSIRSGARDIYVPKVKWFQELDSFIRDVIVKRKTTDYSATSYQEAEFADAEGADNVSRSNENSDDSTNSPDPPVHTSYTYYLNPNSVTETSNQSSKPRLKRSKLSQMAAIIKEMKNVSNNINMSPTVEETEFDIFGKHVAAQLQKLSEEQSVIAQGEIQKILSKCRLADVQRRANLNINNDLHSFD